MAEATCYAGCTSIDVHKVGVWVHMSCTKKDERTSSAEKQSESPVLWTSLIAGGCAGATSRTIVSPLERLKSAYHLV